MVRAPFISAGFHAAGNASADGGDTGGLCQPGTASTLGWLDLLGLAIWLYGFGFEVVGYRQLLKFVRDPTNKGKLMTSGLWRYTARADLRSALPVSSNFCSLNRDIAEGHYYILWKGTHTYETYVIDDCPADYDRVQFLFAADQNGR